MTYVERADRFDADLAAAAAGGDSNRQLIALLGRPRLDSRERGCILVALGESGTGPDGSAAVRAEFSDAMSRLAAIQATPLPAPTPPTEAVARSEPLKASGAARRPGNLSSPATVRQLPLTLTPDAQL
jgi:hypothetical protein